MLHKKKLFGVKGLGLERIVLLIPLTSNLEPSNKETKFCEKLGFNFIFLSLTISSLFVSLSSLLVSCDVFVRRYLFFYSLISVSVFVIKFFNSAFTFRRLYALSGTSTFGGFCASGIRFVNFFTVFFDDDFFISNNYFADANRFATSSQLTTFQNAPTYSARRF